MDLFSKIVFSVFTIFVLILMQVVTSTIVLNVTFLKHTGSELPKCQKTRFGVNPLFFNKKPTNYSWDKYLGIVDISSWTGEITMNGSVNFSNVINRTIKLTINSSLVKVMYQHTCIRYIHILVT